MSIVQHARFAHPRIAIPPAAIDPARERAAFRIWLLAWLIVPNGGFWLMWAIGSPPRPMQIVALALVGLVVRRMPYPIQAIGFVACIGYSMLFFVSAIFNLNIVALLSSVRYLGEMSPTASPEYVAGGIVAVASIAIPLWLMRRRTAFDRMRNLLIAIALTIGAAVIDVQVTASEIGWDRRVAPPGAPFASAVTRSGFGAAADGRHLILVMVESKGVPLDPALRRLIDARWDRPDIARRYAVTRGTTPFWASTTSGELRELCGRWDRYQNLIAQPDPRCLPARLAARGYRTQALHGFDGDYFSRTAWYPRIGFQHLAFRDALLARRADGCPGVFPGACDRDIPQRIAARLRAADRPQFLYWLTINSHLPVLDDARLRTRHCERLSASLARESPIACRLFSLWRDIDEALAREMTAPDFPRADILIVGDHRPPFIDRRSRAFFARDSVPWIMLRAR